MCDHSRVLGCAAGNLLLSAAVAAYDTGLIPKPPTSLSLQLQGPGATMPLLPHAVATAAPNSSVALNISSLASYATLCSSSFTLSFFMDLVPDVLTGAVEHIGSLSHLCHYPLHCVHHLLNKFKEWIDPFCDVCSDMSDIFVAA